jgi:DNA polymerase III sliding clamp (beta) subunit (PCNA family)
VTTLPSGELAEMIEKTLFAVSTDETRLSLGGVFIESVEKNQGIRCAWLQPTVTAWP